MDTEKVEKLIRYFHLPSRMKWYTVDGKILFRLHENQVDPWICYLIRYPYHPSDRKAPWYKYGIEIKPDWTLDIVFKVVQNSIIEFRKALRSVDTAEHYKVDMNGGDLGTGDNKKIIIEEVNKLGHPLE